MTIQSNSEHLPSANELLALPAKICLEAGVLVVHEKKVLLIFHRKLNMWLGPGGHVEPNEPLHVTASRECWEETGISCEIIDPYFPQNASASQFVPSPIHTNVHWVCQENYRRRMSNPDTYQPVKEWKHGCEQHLGFTYLGRADGSITITRDKKETKDAGWFTEKEVLELPTTQTFKIEFAHVFQDILPGLQ